ncbi:FAD-dependent oxidoreductase [uncultured Tateyamaria sp.]|uniref:FAD-dependent oxidoreductase n=1 Tax=uncultured Tateyamaria sp. TaxID=455651 RepID=UPI00261CD716|nr:FAD-dependent oxidoreductase [uncultured Tateyamaria sp.]
MIRIAGAGLAGLATAWELVKRGSEVTVHDAAEPGAGSVSRYAGGMLAPFCEGESAPEDVVRMGRRAAAWWAETTPVTRRGTLVVAPPRDRSELTRFARRTTGHQTVSGAEIAALEPALAGRFSQGLFFAEEAHLDPRRALRDLAALLQRRGVDIRYSTRAPAQVDLVCTGGAAQVPELRPVRGEMALLQAPEVGITRTLRLLHPRVPLYLVPRGAGVCMIGATMIESGSTRPITLRSLSELLNAAYALHPGLAEASVIETGAGLRPAFPDNLPRLLRHDGALHLNGLYRHGFLLAPAMAARAADLLISETCHADHRQRHTA